MNKTLLNDTIDVLIASIKVLNEDDRQKTKHNDEMAEAVSKLRCELADSVVAENDHLKKIFIGADRNDGENK